MAIGLTWSWVKRKAKWAGRRYLGGLLGGLGIGIVLGMGASDLNWGPTVLIYSFSLALVVVGSFVTGNPPEEPEVRG